MLRLKEVATSTPANARASGSHTFVATTAETAFSATPNDAPDASSTEFAPPVGGPATWIATEGDVEILGPITPIRLNGLYALLDAALAASTTHVYTLRKNGSDTGQTVTVGAGGTTAGPSGAAAVTLGSSDRAHTRGRQQQPGGEHEHPDSAEAVG